MYLKLKKLLKFARKFSVYLKPFLKYIIFLVLTTISISFLSLANPFFQKLIFDNIIFGKEIKLFLIILCSYVLVRLITLFLMAINDYLAAYIDESITYNVKTDFIKLLFKLPVSFYDKSRPGEILQRINDTSTVVNVFNIVRKLILDLICFTIFSIFLFFWNSKLAILILIFTPIQIVLKWFSYKLGCKFEQPSWEIKSFLESELIESFSSIRFIKSYSLESNLFRRLLYTNLKLRELDMHGRVLTNIISIIYQFISDLSIALIILIGVIEIVNENLSIGGYIAFFYLSGYVVVPLNNIIDYLTSIEQMVNPIDRLNTVLNIEQETKLFYSSPKKTRIEDITVIEYKDVAFGYEKNNELIRNINFRACKNEILAIIGPSGVGKTSLVNLLLKFYLPTKGEIKINEKLIQEWEVQSLRQLIGIIPQNPYILGGTILENVTLRKKGFSDYQIKNALKMANLLDFVNNLKDGMETKIGEGGMKLSPGEIQKLSFARIFLFNFPIIIMDEPTSSLDFQTENDIMETLNFLYKDRITFIIAHRLSTIRNASKILYLDKGTILESGTHEELIAKKGLYYNLSLLASI